MSDFVGTAGCFDEHCATRRACLYEASKLPHCPQISSLRSFPRSRELTRSRRAGRAKAFTVDVYAPVLNPEALTHLEYDISESRTSGEDWSMRSPTDVVKFGMGLSGPQGLVGKLVLTKDFPARLELGLAYLREGCEPQYTRSAIASPASAINNQPSSRRL